jgi:putative DNA primase/helicase
LLRQAAASCRKRKLAPEIASAKTVAAVERLARSSDRRLTATTGQWKRDDLLLNTPAAAFDLRDLSLQPHRCETYVTKVTTVAPSTAADCPLWLRFLHRMMAGDAGMIAGLWLSANGPY